MSTKNVILGTAATCLAIGSAFASYFTEVIIPVRIGGIATDVSVQGQPTCSGTTKCLVKVRTANGTVTVAAAATLLTSGGHTVPGSGILATIARTLGD